MQASHISILILLAAMVFYVFELLPIPIVAMCSAALMVIFGVTDASSAWAAFASDNVLIMAGACVIGGTLFQTGAADMMAKALIKLAGGKPKLSILLMLTAAGLLSAVMNNTVCTVMFLPLILSVVAKSRDKGIFEQTYMQMLTIVTSVGGMLTLVGSPVNIAASGMLESFGYAGFSMLKLTPVAVPCFLLVLLYNFFIGPQYSKAIFGDSPEPSEFVKNFISETGNKKSEDAKYSTDEEKEIRRKKITSAVIMLLTVIGLLTKNIHGISLGTVAVIGGLLCVITKCITPQQMYSKVEVGTLMMLAGTIGCAAGLSKSGGGLLIAEFLLGLIKNVTPSALYVLICLISAILTQFMSNTATIGIMIPIAIPMAESLGIDPTPLVLGITVCASFSFVTPMASPTQVLVMNWGSYSFIDYVKYSGPITLILDIAGMLLIPLFYPF